MTNDQLTKEQNAFYELEEKVFEKWGEYVSVDEWRDGLQLGPEWTWDEFVEANGLEERIENDRLRMVKEDLLYVRNSLLEDYSEKAYSYYVTHERAEKHPSPHVTEGTSYIPKSQCMRHAGTTVFPRWCLKS